VFCIAIIFFFCSPFPETDIEEALNSRDFDRQAKDFMHRERKKN
jgi:hypothetical protein